MALIGLATPVFDPQGHLYLDTVNNTRITQIGRRLSRTSTLDGGATIADLGHSDSDRTLTIVVGDISDKDLIMLKRMLKLYPILNITTKEGSFDGAISSLVYDTKPLRLTFLVKGSI